jgi:hypothetical protein
MMRPGVHTSTAGLTRGGRSVTVHEISKRIVMVGRVVCCSERRPFAARVWLPELNTSTTATVNWMSLWQQEYGRMEVFMVCTIQKGMHHTGIETQMEECHRQLMSACPAGGGEGWVGN